MYSHVFLKFSCLCILVFFTGPCSIIEKNINDFATENLKTKSPLKKHIPKQEIKQASSPKTNHKKKRTDKPKKQQDENKKLPSKEKPARVLDGKDLPLFAV